jgi:hypothetical protein
MQRAGDNPFHRDSVNAFRQAFDARIDRENLHRQLAVTIKPGGSVHDSG